VTVTDSSETFLDIQPLNSLAICETNPRVMYVFRPNFNVTRSSFDPSFLFKPKLYKTTNGGNSWQDITAGIPSLLDTNQLQQISYLYVKDEDPNTVWATFNGFKAGEKVYESRNGGKTWKNISGSLPNVSANTIVYHPGSKKEGLYIGTDLGVFYKDSTMTDWVPFNKNLPKAIVFDIKIQPQEQAVYAGTFGRGIFRSPLNERVKNSNDGAREGNEKKTEILKVFPTISSQSLTIQAYLSDDVVKTMDVIDMKGAIMRSWAAGVTNINTTIDVSTLANGNYVLRLQTQDGKTLSKTFVVAH
jgi:hypothetical protein